MHFLVYSYRYFHNYKSDSVEPEQGSLHFVLPRRANTRTEYDACWFYATSRKIVIWRTGTDAPLAPPLGELAAPKGAHLREPMWRFSAAIILLRYPLSQPVRLTALPKGEPRSAAVSVRQIIFFLLAASKRFSETMSIPPVPRNRGLLLILPAAPGRGRKRAPGRKCRTGPPEQRRKSARKSPAAKIPEAATKTAGPAADSSP